MIKIKNWSNFQHFKDRNPPWIKLHKSILDERKINLLSDSNFRILIGLWLLASEDENKNGELPEIPDIAFRLRLTEKEINKAIQELKDFLILDDISMISNVYQLDAPETETETEAEAYRKETYRKEAEAEYTCFSQAVDIYNTMAKKNNLSVVQKMTKKRKTSLRQRLKDCGGIEGWKVAMEKVTESNFLLGLETNWKVDFDFLMTEKGFTKLMEDGYKSYASKLKGNGNERVAREAQQLLDKIEQG